MRFLGINYLIRHRLSATRGTSIIDVSLVSLEKNYFPQHFIICVGLCTVRPNIVNRNVVFVWP